MAGDACASRTPNRMLPTTRTMSRQASYETRHQLAIPGSNGPLHQPTSLYISSTCCTASAARAHDFFSSARCFRPCFVSVYSFARRPD